MVLTDLETIQWVVMCGAAVIAFGLGVIAGQQR